jgi:hypothetical protein
MKIYVKKTLTGLIPVYNSDHEALKECKLKIGEEYEVEIKKKRNYKFHKKYFALVNLCFENQSVFEDINDLRYYLTMKSGYVKKVNTGTGEMFIPKSISFSSMDEIEFTDLYQKTINTVCLFLGIDESDLLDEILNFM